MEKSIAILGSTGSIGTQALEVIAMHPDLFEVEVLTANENAGLLIKQALTYLPNHVVIANEAKYELVSRALANHPIKVFAGKDALAEVVDLPSIDMVLTALVGFSGLRPTIRAIEAGKNIALANKETMVAGGQLIKKLAHDKGVLVIPVDSEHSAIFQCMVGEYRNPIEKIILTASGGPFLDMSMDELSRVTKKEALMHPNWCMGDKITIDSASLMNKGLEVIEAKWLFDLKPGQIEVVIHPQSVIHSMVQFEDGSIKAQMGVPDMRLPIHYALNFPRRIKSDFRRFSFSDYPMLTFKSPDTKKFRNLAFAFEAMKTGGNMPCALNAVNEVVVGSFLSDQLAFLQMSDIIEQTLEKTRFEENPDYEVLCHTNRVTRKTALDLIKSGRH